MEFQRLSNCWCQFYNTIDEALAKKVVEGGNRVVDYCWVHCRIEDCPTYIAEHRL